METTFLITDSEKLKKIIEDFSKNKVVEKGYLPFSLQPTFLEKIREKLDNKLKTTFEAAYHAGVDFVEPETQEKFYENEIKKNADKAAEIDEKQREELNNLDEQEKLGYLLFFGNVRAKLERKKIRLNKEHDNPNDVSAIALPKMVVMQIVENTKRKVDTVEKITDDVLLSIFDKLDKSQLGMLRKYFQDKIEARDKEIYENSTFPIYIPEDTDDDYIVEVVTPEISPKVSKR